MNNIICLAAAVNVVFYPALGMAEAGAKSMFADDASTVMMSNEESTPKKNSISKPKAHTVSNSKSSDSDYANSNSESADEIPVSYTGVQYWIDLQEASGNTQRVTTNHTFHSGDGIKLQIKSKSPGYLYVYNQDASGQVTPLYPGKNQDSGMIQPNMIYTIPQRGAIRFDNVPGIEKVTIALAKYPIQSALNNSASSSAVRASNISYGGIYDDCTNSGAGSKGMFTEDSANGMDCIRKNHNAGSKGMFAEEDSASAEPASYSVVPTSSIEAGDVLFVDFNLIHR